MNRATDTLESVRTYRHPNGGGQKVYPAQASPDSYIDGQSALEGETNVYTCTVKNSALRDTVAYGSVVYANSAVCGSHLAEARVRNSDLTRCHVMAATVGNCVLRDTHIFGDNGESPYLSGVNLTGVYVYGGVQLTGGWGMELEGAHIHAGVWTKQPRHMLVEGDGVHVAVMECTDGRAHMGCECRTVDYWLTKGARLARRLGWNARQIEECLSFLETLKASTPTKPSANS
jgi:hypothetical protein